MGEGLNSIVKNERSYLSNLTINLLDLEFKMLKKIVSGHTDDEGYGVGTVNPGFCIH